MKSKKLKFLSFCKQFDSLWKVSPFCVLGCEAHEPVYLSVCLNVQIVVSRGAISYRISHSFVQFGVFEFKLH